MDKNTMFQLCWGNEETVSKYEHEGDHFYQGFAFPALAASLQVTGLLTCYVINMLH